MSPSTMKELHNERNGGSLIDIDAARVFSLLSNLMLDAYYAHKLTVTASFAPQYPAYLLFFSMTQRTDLKWTGGSRCCAGHSFEINRKA